MGTTYTKSKQRRSRSDLPSDDEHSENFDPHKAPKVPHIKDIEETVRKLIQEASQQLYKEVEPCGLRTSNSPLSEKITLSLLPQEVCEAEIRMLLWGNRFHPAPPAVPGQDNSPFLLSHVFSSSLKGVSYD